jgi:D-alanyl-D-alanine carboxypeptidase
MTTQSLTPDPRISSPSGRRRRRAGFAAAGVALIALALPATGSAAPAPNEPEPAGRRLQSILDRAVRSPAASFPGVALRVRRPGHAAWTGAAGKASIAPSRPMRAGDRFRAGSIMKPLVATATLQLVEEGRFALEDTLPAVLPRRVIGRFPEADRITVRMLLNHTSGLGDFADPGFDAAVFADPRRRWATPELLDRAAALPRLGAPGERHAYSNTNYTLLGLVLEQATGRPWRSVVRRRVIDRLRLRGTSLPAPGSTPAGRGIVHGYERVGGALRDLTRVDPSMAGAAGGHALLTTTTDLARFMDAVLAGRLFERRETLREMRTFVAAADANGKAGYGLGIERWLLPGGVELIGHLGSTGGYRAFVGRAPAHDIDIALVINTRDDPTPVLLSALKVLTAAA